MAIHPHRRCALAATAALIACCGASCNDSTGESAPPAAAITPENVTAGGGVQTSGDSSLSNNAILGEPVAGGTTATAGPLTVIHGFAPPLTAAPTAEARHHVPEH